jgi:hypothetical protein
MSEKLPSNYKELLDVGKLILTRPRKTYASFDDWCSEFFVQYRKLLREIRDTPEQREVLKRYYGKIDPETLVRRLRRQSDQAPRKRKRRNAHGL